MKTYESKESRLLLAKTLAEEGIILLKNDAHLLPLTTGTDIAVFGRGQVQTLIGGGGSGASSSDDATIILDELQKIGLSTNKKLANYYENELKAFLDSRQSDEKSMEEFEGLVNSGLIYEIFGRYTPPTEEYKIPSHLISEISPDTLAFCVISRGSGGEECDRRVEEDYYLTKSEKQMIDKVTNHFKKVVLILNINGFIDLSWTINNASIQSILYLGTAGEQGAKALAEVITGNTTPSGKLAATMALNFYDYPSSKSFFTNKDKPETILTYEDYGLSSSENGSHGFAKSPVALYEEGIYVGYRYFDTFNKEVLYPFGYGLSYASFDMELTTFSLKKDTLELNIKTRNTSSKYHGKEVVQLYVSAPNGKLEKPYQELLVYAKTKCLAPMEWEDLHISIPLTELACYDEESATYVIEPGDYYIRLGNSSRNTNIIGKIIIDELITTAILKNRLSIHPSNKGKLNFLTNKGVTPISYPNEIYEKDRAITLCKLSQDNISILSIKVDNIPTSCKSTISTLSEVKQGKVSMESFVAQFTLEELSVLANGYGPGLPFGAMVNKYPATIFYDNGTEIGTNTHPVGAHGYISPALKKYGIPSVFYKDGPAGVQKIAWPTGMSMACTFNKHLLYEFGHACGTEAESLQVDSWLAPAVNIQRNPIGGRNFEYYSEDPRHTGYCGLYIALGTEQNNKVTTCPKHFAINEQETYRRGSIKKSYDAIDSIIEERAAREIYLKPFEMMVRGSKVCTFMTSFNKINGVFAGGNKELCTNILREEWGYKGVVVTDWGDMDIVVDGADAVAAGNDIIMPGGPPVINQVLEGYKEGRCSIYDLRKAASNLMYFIINSGSFSRYEESKQEFK